MQKFSARGHRLLHEAWLRKTSVFGGALAIVSLSLAHYAGFLSNVPLQIVAVAGMPLAKGVSATFFFYVFFCAVLARVLTSMNQLILLPGTAVIDRLGRGIRRKMDFPRQRKFVRTHHQTIKWESYIWLTLQGLIFLSLMFAIYIKFTATWISSIELVASIVFVTLSGLVRSGFFLQPNINTFIRKIQTRTTQSARAASAVFVTIAAAFVVVSFFLGTMRMKLLIEQDPQMIVTKDFTGMANIIASADGSLLLFQKEGKELRYIYSTPEFITSVESSKSFFPPIGTKAEQK